MSERSADEERTECEQDAVVWGDLELSGGSGAAEISLASVTLDDDPDEVTVGISIDDHHLQLSLPPVTARDIGEELIDLADECDEDGGAPLPDTIQCPARPVEVDHDRSDIDVESGSVAITAVREEEGEPDEVALTVSLDERTLRLDLPGDTTRGLVDDLQRVLETYSIPINDTGGGPPNWILRGP